MQELMNKVVLSCQKATELTEKKQEITITNREKIQLFFHLKLCSGCSAYQKQSELISKALRQEGKHSRSGSGLKKHILSPVIKESIIKTISEGQN